MTDTPRRPNVITFDEVMQTADQLGAQHGLSQDVQVKSLLKCFEAGYHGALDLKKHKHGPDRDDASMFAERYYKARTGQVIFDHKADNQQKLASTCRTMIRFGSSPKFTGGEPVASMNKLMGIYQAEKLKNRKIMDDAATVVLKFAREAQKQDLMLSDEELKQLIYKKPKEEISLGDYLDGVVKKLDKLVDGTAPGNLQHKVNAVLEARQLLRQERVEVAKQAAADRDLRARAK